MKQQRDERRVVLDPKLGLKKTKGGRSAPLKTHWSLTGYRPRTMTEKARAKADAVAKAFQTPSAPIRGSSFRVAMQHSLSNKPAPVYAEPEFEQPAQKKRILPPTRYVARTVTVKAPSSMENPYRGTAIKRRAAGLDEAKSVSSITQAQETAVQPMPVIKSLPGITVRRREIKPEEPALVHAEAADSFPRDEVKPAPPPPSSSPAQSQPEIRPIHQQPIPSPSIKKRPPPSLFIPRKRLKG